MSLQTAAVLFTWVLVNQAGVPIPVTPSLLVAGALAAHADSGMLLPALVAVIAALIADFVWYGLGRWRGRQALGLLARLSPGTAGYVGKAERCFNTHQLVFLFAGRFVPELNPIAAGMAGATRTRSGRYAVIATASAVVWAVTWTGAGYAFINVMSRIAVPFAPIMTLLALASAMVVASIVLIYRRGISIRPVAVLTETHRRDRLA